MESPLLLPGQGVKGLSGNGQKWIGTPCWGWILKWQRLSLGVMKNMFSEPIVLGVSWGFKYRETLLRVWEQLSSQ